MRVPDTVDIELGGARMNLVDMERGGADVDRTDTVPTVETVPDRER